jgi:ABC-type phosphate transport system substrate-binding protein
MKSFISVLIVYALTSASAAVAQDSPKNKVIITGVRFAYPMIEEWILNYKSANPAAEIIIDPRAATDPAKYDLLIEAYEQDQAVKDTRDYLYVARYALLPVSNASSRFASIYGKKGLTKNQIKQLYFHDLLAETDEDEIKIPVTVYTRLQKAGAPITFAHYYGYEQQDIKGKVIAGADEHLIKALLKDSTGVSYATLNLLYNVKNKNVLPGLTIIPVDQDDNGRISENEKSYSNLDALLQSLEEKERKNIPVEYLHLSIGKLNTNPEALKFLLWVIENSQDNLHALGFLKPDLKRFETEKEKFEQRAQNR